MNSQQLMTIREMCDAYEVTPRTLRFYEQKELLFPIRENTKRLYTRRDRARLKLILRGKRFGFSLEEIRQLLDLYHVGDQQRTQLSKAYEIAQDRLAEMLRQREDLDAAIGELKEQMKWGEHINEQNVVVEQLPPDVTVKQEWYWDHIIESMEEVMHGLRGTAKKSAEGASYRMAGKTGTAQVIAIKQGEKYDADAIAAEHRDHGLFVGFAPVRDPKLALAVVVENGGGGSSAAAPVARKIFDAYLLGIHQDAKLASSDGHGEIVHE